MFGPRKPIAKIFINYRRDDARWVAGRLLDTLRRYFGDDRVFRDVEGIAGGAEFGDVIQQTMKSSDAVIVWKGGDGWPFKKKTDVGTPELIDPWQAVITYLAIMISSILLLVFAPLVNESRRSYMYASGLVGILGAGFFIILVLPLAAAVEPVVLFFGSTVTATAMFTLMNLSGFKPK